MKKFYIMFVMLAGVATNYVFCSEGQEERNQIFDYMAQSGNNEMIRMLQGQVADSNVRDEYSNPPLHVAVQRRNSSIIRHLIAHGIIQDRQADEDQQGAVQEVQADESPEPQVDIANFECPICFESVESQNMVHRVCQNTAQHAVCVLCYGRMVVNLEMSNSNNRCPLCRGPRYQLS